MGFRRNLLLVAFSLLIALLAMESILRIAGIGYPATVLFQFDPKLGHVLRPNFAGSQHDEGHARVAVNRFGHSGGMEITEAKPAGVLRVAVLGDSYTEAMAVDPEQSFVQVAERQLNQRLGRKVEVLNFGVSGYGTCHELLMLRERVWKFSPDIVVLAFLTGNDLENNLYALDRSATVYCKQEGDRIVPDYSRLDRPSSLNAAITPVKDSLIYHSNLLQLGFQLRKILRQRRIMSQRKDTNAGQIGEFLALQVYLPPSQIEPPKRDNWEQAWSLTEALISRMNREVREKNAKFLLMTLSNAIQVHPDPAKREEFQRQMKAENLLYPDKRLQALAEREQIPLLQMAPVLQAEAEKTKTFFHGFANTVMGSGHWNVEGNRRGGELLAEKLAAIIRQ